MKTKSNIMACVRTPKQNFYVRIVEGGYAVQRGAHTNCNVRDLTDAIAKMLRLAWFETKQTEINFG